MLRLVNDADDSRHRTLRFDNTPSVQERIAQANAHSSRLTEDDARWIFAQRVQGALQGGRAAILPPSTRQELVSSAVRAGLRPFDANLVIAIVQDDVRSGASRVNLETAPPGLSMVRPARDELGWRWMAAVGVVVFVLAGAIAGLLISWLSG